MSVSEKLLKQERESQMCEKDPNAAQSVEIVDRSQCFSELDSKKVRELLNNQEGSQFYISVDESDEQS